MCLWSAVILARICKPAKGGGLAGPFHYIYDKNLRQYSSARAKAFRGLFQIVCSGFSLARVPGVNINSLISSFMYTSIVILQ